MSLNVIYLCYHSDMLLSDYEYVHQCLKFGTDVHVIMVMLADANQTFSYEVRNPEITNCISYAFALVCSGQRG